MSCVLPRNRPQNVEPGVKQAGTSRRSAATTKLWEDAYHRIREGILRGDFPLGSPLSRRKLAAECRMSLLPVSEALRRLELDGFVETEARVGTRVRIPTPKDLEEHTIVRTALECESARLFCERANAEDRKDLLARGERLDDLRAHSGNLALDDPLAYAVRSYHIEFHLRIADGAGCGGLRRLLEQNQVLAFNWLYDVAAGSFSMPPPSHADLARVIAGKRPEEATGAIRAHIWYAWDNLVREFSARYWKDGDLESAPLRRWRSGNLLAQEGHG
jgi:DNA-binding GntR family transcriptional regulator